jgi:uncharacterized membrane protein
MIEETRNEVFKKFLMKEKDINFMVHFMKEIIKDNELMLMMTDIDLRKLMNERTKLIFGYLCWPFRIISIEKRIHCYLRFEEFIYENEIFQGERCQKG